MVQKCSHAPIAPRPDSHRGCSTMFPKCIGSTLISSVAAVVVHSTTACHRVPNGSLWRWAVRCMVSGSKNPVNTRFSCITDTASSVKSLNAFRFRYISRKSSLVSLTVFAVAAKTTKTCSCRIMSVGSN